MLLELNGRANQEVIGGARGVMRRKGTVNSLIHEEKYTLLSFYVSRYASLYVSVNALTL